MTLFRGDLRRDFPRRARRARLDGVVSGAVAEQLRHLAKFPQPAALGRLCRLDLLHRFGVVLVHWIDPRPGDVARSRHLENQEIPLWHFCGRLARIEPQLAPLRNGLSLVSRPLHSAGAVSAQCCLVRFRYFHFADLAHHHFPALLRRRRHLRRVRHGPDVDAAGARVVQIARHHHAPAHRQNGEDHFADGLDRFLCLRHGIFLGLVQRQSI